MACADNPSAPADGGTTPDAAMREDSGPRPDAAPARDAATVDSGEGAPDVGSPDLDSDRDGHPASLDCDDSDPEVFPGNPEICDGKDNDCNLGVDDGIPNDGAGCADPGPPAFPETIGTLSVALLTADLATAGTDANQISLCLTASDCFRLDAADVDDHRRGEMDVYHFEGINLPRTAVDQVTLQSRSGRDRWVPQCMQIQFDGQPVYCHPDILLQFGDASSEVEDWTDPLGLHQACASCYPTALTHGPMVGTVTSSQARVWFRTDATRQVKVRISAQDDLSQVAPAAYVYPAAGTDYAAEINIRGLQPETTYSYDLESPAGRTQKFTFTTAPAPGAGTIFNFAFGSCAKTEDQPIFSVIQERSPSLFLFAGDNHYANSNDLNSLRWYYRWSLARPQRAALAATTPTLATWDDHDYVGNNTDGDDPGKDVALRAFGDYWANPFSGTAQTPGVFFNYQYGDVEFFLLDDRYHRSAGESLLGPGQTTWLMEALAASQATFKFLVSGSQWTQQGSNDSWAAFPESYDALFGFIADEGIAGVILLSGDIHRSQYRLHDRPGGYDIPELTSSPLARSNNPPCGSLNSELRTCFGGDNYFIDVQIDTTLADPVVNAVLVNSEGTEVAHWLIPASQLQP